MSNLRRMAHSCLGLCAFLVLVAILWGPVLPFVPRDWFDRAGGIAPFRWSGALVLAVLLIVRHLIRPPSPPSRKAVSWGELASTTGGTVSQELRSFGTMGWTGGVAVRWDIRGTEMKLIASKDGDGNETTHFLAEVALARGFQFHLLPENLLTKIFMSEQVWNLAVSAVRAQARNQGIPNGGGVRSSDVADRLAFLTTKELVIGDPKFDDAFLLKSDAASEAREFFSDASVAHALHDLHACCKGWQLSLMSRDGASAYQLTLAVPGTMLEPQGLDAARKLFETSIRCLGDRGFLASPKSHAA